MAQEAAVQVEDLVVRRGKRDVLRGLSCVIPRGAVTGLLGPSGSGKTTMLRADRGRAEDPQRHGSGSGRHCRGRRPCAGRWATSPSRPSVYGDLTVAQNLAYFAAIAGVGPRQDR